VLSHLLQDHVCLLQPAVPFLVPPRTAGAALSYLWSFFFFFFLPRSCRSETAADQPTEFRQRPKQAVASGNVPRRRSSCIGRQTGMSRSCHFRSPSPTISMQPLYAVRLPVRVSDQAKCINNPTWRTRVFLTCCVSVQDTGGYEGHIFTGPHRLPTRDEVLERNSNGCRCT
jgi:hypothetical protein